jgi:two-component system response regulator HydG
MAMNPPVPRVLVVDDSWDMARSLCDGLLDGGYEALPVASGKEALALLARESFEAVVTDLRMPDVDGFEVISFAKACDAQRPIIAMTGALPLETAAESLRRGAARCLIKPFRGSELSAALADLLGRRAGRPM